MNNTLQLLPEVLAHIKGYDVRARLIVYGWLSGVHPSAFRGQSIEFSEHRPYVPGDDPRYIDWRATAKFDKYFLKMFEHEASTSIFIILDTSGSMNYTSSIMTKLEYSLTLAAAIAYLGIIQGDRVSLIYPGATSGVYSVPPGGGYQHYLQIVQQMENLGPAGSMDFISFVEEACHLITRTSLVFIFSDFLDCYNKNLKLFLTMKTKNVDLRILHVLDRSEWNFPFRGYLIFKGLEEEKEIEVDATRLRNRYQELMRKFSGFVEDESTRAGGLYHRILTDQSFEAVLNEICSIQKIRRRV